MKDWKAELDAYFQRREQHDAQQQPEQDRARTPDETTAVEEFMATVVVPAFEEFGSILKEHRRHIRLRLGDSNMRIVAEYAGREEFDYTLWAGGNGLSAELRAGGRHTPDSFQNAKGNSALADTTQEDIARQLAERYIAFAAPTFS
ncbi:MAG TPA: hypothetical protein VFX24_13605 [Ktedonobacterales bacterium]|jgi:hypothetical protein|nr:hypothetical protein [Ktedonobacterales bacterium]